MSTSTQTLRQIRREMKKNLQQKIEETTPRPNETYGEKTMSKMYTEFKVIYTSSLANCFFPYTIDVCRSFAHATGIYFGYRDNYPDPDQLIRLVVEFDDRTVICDTYRSN